MRVLLIAEAANPTWVSVPLVGWSHSRAIAEHPDVDALTVTQIRNREAWLEAGCKEGEDGDFVAIDSEAVAKPLNAVGGVLRGGSGKGWTMVTAISTLAYYDFERRVWKQFKAKFKAGEFDLVHRITPLSPTTPSYYLPRKLSKLGIPFVVGPLNGGVPWPKAYDNVRRQEREWLSYVREAYKLLPGYKSTRSKAAAIIAGSRDTLEQLPQKYADKIVYMPENAVEPERFNARRTPRSLDHQGDADQPLRIAFVGRLVPYKGADVLIEAAAPLVKAGRVTLDIIGDGPQMDRLREMVAEHDIAGGVGLAGWVEHEQVQHRLAKADVFGFPSIREFGGGVVLEAMMVGLVPVVVAYGGPAELITPATGIGVSMGPRPHLVEKFREALTELADDPQRVESMSQAALRRVSTLFTWQAKAEQSLGVYRWVLGQADKPDMPLPLPDPA